MLTRDIYQSWHASLSLEVGDCDEKAHQDGEDGSIGKNEDANNSDDDESGDGKSRTVLTSGLTHVDTGTAKIKARYFASYASATFNYTSKTFNELIPNPKPIDRA